MNPDAPQNPREQLETRLTALLLGELNADEAAALREILARDAALAALHERLRQTIDLVRVAAYDPATETAEQPAPLKLSDSRRQKLLAEFKTVKPPQFAPPPRRKWYALHPAVAVAAVLAMAAVLAGLLMPALSRSKSKEMSMAAYRRAMPFAGEADGQRLRDVMVEESTKGGQLSTTVMPPTPAPIPVVPPVAAPVPPARTEIVLPSTAESAGDQGRPGTAGTYGAWQNGGAVANFTLIETNRLEYANRFGIVDADAAAKNADLGIPMPVRTLNPAASQGLVPIRDSEIGRPQELARLEPRATQVNPRALADGVDFPTGGAGGSGGSGRGIRYVTGSNTATFGIPYDFVVNGAKNTNYPYSGIYYGANQPQLPIGMGSGDVHTASNTLTNGAGAGTVFFTNLLGGDYTAIAMQPDIQQFTNRGTFYNGSTRDDVGGQGYLDGKYVNANPITMVPDDSGLRFKFMEQSNDPRAVNGAPTETAGRTHVGGSTLTNVQYVSNFGGVTNTNSLSVMTFGNAVVTNENPALLNLAATNRFAGGSDAQMLAYDTLIDASTNDYRNNLDRTSVPAASKGMDWTGTLQTQYDDFMNLNDRGGRAGASDGRLTGGLGRRLDAVNQGSSASTTDRLRGIRGSAGPANLAFTNGSMAVLGAGSNLVAHRFAFTSLDDTGQPSESSNNIASVGGATKALGYNYNPSLIESSRARLPDDLVKGYDKMTTEVWSAVGGNLTSNAVDSIGGATAVLQNQNVAQTQTGSATPGMTHRWSFNEPPETTPVGGATVAGGAVTITNGAPDQPLVVIALHAQKPATPQPAATLEPKIYTLANAEPEDVKQVLKDLFPETPKVQTFTGIPTDEQFRRAMSPKDKSTIVLPAREQPVEATYDTGVEGSFTGKTLVAAANKVEPGPVAWPGQADLLRKRLDTPALAESAGAGRGSGGGGGAGGGGRRGGAGGGFGGGFGTTDGARDYPNSTVYGPVTVSIEPETGRVFVMGDQGKEVSINLVITNLDRSGGNNGGLVQLNLMQLGTPTTIDGNAVPTTTPGSVLAKVVDLADAQRLRNLARRRGTNGNPGQVAVEEASKLGAGAGDSSGTAIGDGRMMFDETTKRSYIVTDKNVYEKLADVATFQNRGEAANTTASKPASTSVTNSGIHPVFQTTAGVTGAPGGNQVTWVDDSGNPVTSDRLTQDGRLLYELGKYDEAERKLKAALRVDSGNVVASQYARMVAEQRNSGAAQKSDNLASKSLVQVEQAYNVPQRDRQPVPRPNIFNRTNTVRTGGAGKQEIAAKLNAIQVAEVNYPEVPLKDVLADLAGRAKDRDPEKKGINFFLENDLSAANHPLNLSNLNVNVAVNNGRLTDVLDAITKASPEPIKYTVLEYGVMFSRDTNAPAKPAAQPVPPSADNFVPQPAPPLVPQPEVVTRENAFSTFSLNVADVAFKLAAASLQKGLMPDPGTVRSEEFINAFDYRDPEPAPGAAVAFASEQAHYPFAHNRDLLRFSLKTAAAGRVPGRPLNLVLLLDKSGSMERADRVAIIREALRVLAGQLQPGDKISVITFARLAHLWADGVSGEQAAAALEAVSGLTPEGGTNLEEAMRLAYATALRHYLANGVNRVVLLTDGAANLGNVDPAALKVEVETHRKQGIALDCFGIGWEGYNDDLLEVLSRNGDGRYGFINSPEEAATGFAGQLAGALRVAASDVKVQVEFNPKRVTSYRQIGYAKHQLTKEQFRDNTVNAAQIGAAEAGNALYTVEVNPAGEGPLATVHVRYRDPGTQNYYEHEWAVPYTGLTVDLDRASPAMRLAGTASAFSEWLAQSPYAGEVTTDHLLNCLSGVPEVFGADARPKQLEWMIRQAKAITGK